MYAIYECLECGAKRVYGVCAPEAGASHPVLIVCDKQGVNTMHGFAWLVEHWDRSPRPLIRQTVKDLAGYRHHVEENNVRGRAAVR